jgi:hypothetical protein
MRRAKINMPFAFKHCGAYVCSKMRKAITILFFTLFLNVISAQQVYYPVESWQYWQAYYLNGFKFDMINHGDVYIHNSLSATFPGSFQNLGDFTAPYTDQLNESWLLTEGADTTITISNNAFLGFYTGVKTYKIIGVTDSTLHLQYAHHAGGLLWYLKLKTE